MFAWFQKIMPREEKFFDYFEQHAQTLVEGSRALRELLEPGSDIAACAARVSKFEQDADDSPRRKKALKIIEKEYRDHLSQFKEIDEIPER